MKKNIRKRILNILSEPATVTSIKTKLKDVESFGTIAYHLKNLEKEGLVDKKKDRSKRGTPTTYFLINKDLIEIIKQSKESTRTSRMEILDKIKENPMIEDAILTLFLERSNLPETALDEVFSCADDKLITIHLKITPKGQKFLDNNNGGKI